MANDAITAALAANRDVPACKPGSFQDCSDIVHISVFFDGTGNNRKNDDEKKKWSNIARMFDSALERQDPSKAIYTIYISGIGTPYNGKPVKWLSEAGVWIEDGMPGMGAGAGGSRRLDQGDDAVSDRLRDILINSAKKLGGEAKQYADASASKSFSEVNAALGKHRLIKMINLSVFGFSRGASLARAFSNQVLKQCKQQGKNLCYQGYPIRLNFMGLFDTVASFGVPAANVRLPFDERDLIVSPTIERCVHYVAAHEVRFSFPVDLIRKDGKLADKWVETTYPGVHSDVGGGYEPTAQGIDNNYARIPMRDMMREAVLSGVRMFSYDEMRKIRFQTFQERFECRADTEAAYKQYMAACGTVTGSIEQQIKQHQKLFISANGSMHRTGLKTPGDRQREASLAKQIGPKGMAWEIEKYRAAAKLSQWVRVAHPIHDYAQFIKPQAWQIAAWDATAPAGAVDFVAKFIHDSKVDFISNLAEPFSYFKPRGVEESTISIWQEGGNWIAGKAKIVSDTATSTYESAEAAAQRAAKAAQEAALAAKKKAEEAAQFAKKKAEEAAQFGKKKAEEAADYTQKKIDQATEAAKAAAEATAYAAQLAALEAERQAVAAAAYATKKAEQAAEATKSAGKAIEQGAQGVADDAARLIEKGVSWVKQAIH